MPHLVIGHDAYVAEFVKRLIPQADDFGMCTAIGVAHGGALIGGVVFNGWQPRYGSVHLHFAAVDSRWLIGPPGDRRGVIRDILSYPFRQLKVQRLTGITPKRCRRARAVIDKLGFKREGVARRGFGDDDAILSGLLLKEWEAGPYAAPEGYIIGAAS